VRAFEETVAADLERLLRAGVPVRAVRITVRELVVARLGRGALGPAEVADTVGSTVRAAGRLARERGVADELVEAVCRAALEGVRGHGGASARWLDEALEAMLAVLDELAREPAAEPDWRALARRLGRH
jgi:hypothetical protein